MNTYWKSDGEGNANFDFVPVLKYTASGGSQVSVAGGNAVITAGITRFDHRTPGQSAKIALTAASGTTVSFEPNPTTSTTHGYVLPPTDGEPDQVLGNDGQGNLTWVDLPSSGGGPVAAITLSTAASDGSLYNLSADDSGKVIYIRSVAPVSGSSATIVMPSVAPLVVTYTLLVHIRDDGGSIVLSSGDNLRLQIADCIPSTCVQYYSTTLTKGSMTNTLFTLTATSSPIGWYVYGNRGITNLS